MMLPRLLLFLALVAAAWPAGAAAGVRVVTHEVPLGETSGRSAARVLTATDAPARFNLVGIHWRGSGNVEFRTAPRGGDWSPWRRARPEAEDRPDPGTAEASRASRWKLGNPWWTGPARRIQYRTSGPVKRLRAHFLWSAESETPRSSRTLARASAPTVIRRRSWGADESIVRSPPWYADRVAFAVVHHTAGASPSSRAESAAIVRGIQAYHVRSNGWNDIGYNFLVDRFGQVFEGRGGGIAKNVVGAHAMGFNTGSVGVAVLGSYGSSGISRRARKALVSLLAWRLDVAHVDPQSRVRRVSAGSPRFPAGETVTLDAIGGHRDTGLTSCPGAVLYGQLGTIRSAVAARGLPKLYDPTVSGNLGGLVQIRARLSTSRDWTVRVTDGTGAEVARGTGTGTLVDWTWDSSAISPGTYFYEIRAGWGIRRASGTVGTLVPLELDRVAAAPNVVTPNGDGVSDATMLRFSLSTAASVRVSIRDADGGTVATPAHRWFPAGRSGVAWNGATAGGEAAPDGTYTVLFEATAGAQAETKTRTLVVDRTLGPLAVRRSSFSPNGDGVRDTARLDWTLTRAADVRLRVVHAGSTAATLVDGELGAGPHTVVWDGTAAGVPLPDGTYRAVVTATTALGKRRVSAELELDTTAPVLSRLSARRRNGGTLVRFTLDERARVVVALGARTVRVRRDAGSWTLWRSERVRRVGVFARDAAANRSGERLLRVRR